MAESRQYSVPAMLRYGSENRLRLVTPSSVICFCPSRELGVLVLPILLLLLSGVHRHRASDQAPALSFKALCARIVVREQLVE